MSNMNIKRVIIRILGVIGFSFFAVTSMANAAILDFTKSPFIGISGFVAGTTYDVTASGGSLNWSQSHDGSTCIGLACQIDGLGVRDDEITRGNEEIRIEFGTAVRVTGLAFLDLFTSRNGRSRERAVINYDGGSIFFDALASQFPGSTSGFRSENGLNIVTSYLAFTAGGSNDEIGSDDYALAAVTVSAVPLPPSLIMFGIAMGGIGYLARRRKKTATNLS